VNLLYCKTTPLFYNVSEQEGSYKSFYNILYGLPVIKEGLEGNMVLSDREKELREKLRTYKI